MDAASNRARFPDLAAFVDSCAAAGLPVRVLLIEDQVTGEVISRLGRKHAYEMERRLAVLPELREMAADGIKASARRLADVTVELDQLRREVIPSDGRSNTVRRSHLRDSAGY